MAEYDYDALGDAIISHLQTKLGTSSYEIGRLPAQLLAQKPKQRSVSVIATSGNLRPEDADTCSDFDTVQWSVYMMASDKSAAEMDETWMEMLALVLHYLGRDQQGDPPFGVTSCLQARPTGWRKDPSGPGRGHVILETLVEV